MIQRYVVQREACSDFAVVDTARGNVIAVSGLDEQEAEETAAAWNKRLAENLQNNS